MLKIGKMKYKYALYGMKMFFKTITSILIFFHFKKKEDNDKNCPLLNYMDQVYSAQLIT